MFPNLEGNMVATSTSSFSEDPSHQYFRFSIGGTQVPHFSHVQDRGEGDPPPASISLPASSFQQSCRPPPPPGRVGAPRPNWVSRKTFSGKTGLVVKSDFFLEGFTSNLQMKKGWVRVSADSIPAAGPPPTPQVKRMGGHYYLGIIEEF